MIDPKYPLPKGVKVRNVEDRYVDRDAFFGAVLLKHGSPDRDTFYDRAPHLPYGVRPRSMAREAEAREYEWDLRIEFANEFLAPARIAQEFLRWLGANGGLNLKRNRESQGRAASAGDRSSGRAAQED